MGIDDWVIDRGSTTDRTIHISHADIANDLSVSREAISRLLKKLEEQGKVELGRNKIILKD